MLKRLWNEEVGAIVSAEIMLVATILVIGAIVGLKSVRDSVVTELADVAQAIGNVNQSYSYSGVSGHHAFTAGAAFTDNADDARRVHEALDSMSPPEGAGRRTSVQTFELLLDEQLG